MVGALAAVMVVVTLSCLARALLPALRPLDHGRDVDAWHVVMSAAMAAMLLFSWARPLSLLGLVVFVGGLAWATGHAAGRATRAAYLRVGVGCVAMAAMLLPPATASAASPAMPGGSMAGMTGMTQAVPTPGADRGDLGLAPPTALLALLLAALGFVLVVRLLVSFRTSSSVPARLEAGSDVAMAAVMGYLIVSML